MKKISWITPSCFVDVDLPIINDLRYDYKIDWIVILLPKNGDDTKQYIQKFFRESDNLIISYFWQTCRLRSIKNILFTFNVLQFAKSVQPDIIYTSEYAMPYGVMLYKLFLPMKKTVAACHNVSTPKGASNELFAKFYTSIWLKVFKNIHTFSASQLNVLKQKYRNKNVLLAHLAIKDYGIPSIAKNETGSTIVFLMFGNIIRYKRVDLLLKATNVLYDRGIRDFKVRIAGCCDSWKEEYAPLVEHTGLLDLHIKRIPNEEVANLFADSHYFVMPYQDIAQSGAITVAFRYNLPVLCSDIEQFKEFVENGETGFCFKSGDYESLADKMEWIIQNHTKMYDNIRQKQRRFVDDNFSLKSITDKYKSYFDSL